MKSHNILNEIYMALKISIIKLSVIKTTRKIILQAGLINKLWPVFLWALLKYFIEIKMTRPLLKKLKSKTALESKLHTWLVTYHFTCYNIELSIKAIVHNSL